MTRETVLAIYVVILAIFTGYEVISRVPSILHTPLMSATNAIHGIVLLGAIIVLGAANVFGGFVVTDRMLEMFKKKVKEEVK
jgi:NAD(P) transhydrogenase subunit alpha